MKKEFSRIYNKKINSNFVHQGALLRCSDDDDASVFVAF